LVSKRTLKKYKILRTLANAELTAEDIESYTGIEQTSALPVMKDLQRWRDIEIAGEEINYYTERKRKLYTTTPKGEEKLKYFKKKYGLQ